MNYDWGGFNTPDKTGFTSIRKEAWLNTAKALYCIGVLGLSLQSEIAETVGIQPSSRSAYDLFSRLVKDGWIEQFVVPLMGKYWRVGMSRLTTFGRTACEQWWSIIPSDLDVMFENHQGEEQERHTAAVLLLTRYARKCGYKTTIAPHLENTLYDPDVLVDNGLEKYYVEVEVSRKGLDAVRGKQNWLHKWVNQYGYQNTLAICTLTPTKRLSLVRKLKPRWRGVATDLVTLRKVCKLPDPELWIDQWSWNHGA